MTQQTINVGIQANDRQGDPLRIAFQKINSNFTELYTLSSDLPYSLPTASATTLGGVKVDGTSIVVNGEGVISSTNNIVATNLDDLTDVAITSPSNGQVLKYNGTNWVNGTDATDGLVGGVTSYNDLTDRPTIPTSIFDLDVPEVSVNLPGYLYYSGTTLTWESALGVTSYNDLTDKPHEITNTDGVNTWNISVATTGVISMNTARGGIEFGAMPEVGGPAHLHIMRPAGQNSSTDLYFGDDYNYVKMPGLYGSDPNGQQGVEIGSSLNEGTVNVWKFGTDGSLTLPGGGAVLNNETTGSEGLYYRDFSIQLENPDGSAPIRWGFRNDGKIELPSGNTTIGNLFGSDGIISASNTAFGVISQGITGFGGLQWFDTIDEPLNVAGIAVNSPYAASTGSVQIYTGIVGIPPQNAWTFDPTGHLTLPVGGDIKDSNGVSVLAASTMDFIAPQSEVDPADPQPGRIYYNSTTGKFRGFNGIDMIWQDLN